MDNQQGKGLRAFPNPKAMKIRLFFLLFICLLTACEQQSIVPAKTAASIRSVYLNDTVSVMVVAHRGYWREAPENSLAAIEAAINLGVDMVEIDIRLTADSVPILMHDTSLDRTTSRIGNVSDYQWSALKDTRLKNGLGRITNHRIPTLKEAMELARGKVLINLDKCYDFFPLVYPVLVETGTVDQVVMKGWESNEQVKEDLGAYLDEILYMPVISLDRPDALVRLNEFVTDLNPEAIEFIFSSDEMPLVQRFAELSSSGTRVWVNSLWDELCGGHSDDLAVDNPDAAWGWLIDHGVNIIQTDRPAALLDHLNHE